MTDLNVSIIDVLILVAYVVGTRVFFGWWFARKVSRASQREDQGAEQYFLAGRELKWPIDRR